VRCYDCDFEGGVGVYGEGEGGGETGYSGAEDNNIFLFLRRKRRG